MEFYPMVHEPSFVLIYLFLILICHPHMNCCFLVGVLGHGSGSYQPIPKVVGGVKRAVSVAAGGDYTLVLTSAYVPEMPFSDIICNTVDGVSRNQNLHQNYGKVDKSGRGNIVVVMGSSIVSSTAVRSSEGEGRASDINKNDSSSDNESEDDYDDYEMNYSDGADISRGSTLCAPEVIPVGNEHIYIFHCIALLPHCFVCRHVTSLCIYWSCQAFF